MKNILTLIGLAAVIPGGCLILPFLIWRLCKPKQQPTEKRQPLHHLNSNKHHPQTINPNIL